MSKPRNKKYNPRKSAPVIADQYLKLNKLAVWFTCDHKTARVVSLKTNNVFDPDSKTANYISNFDHFWSYTLVIFCRDQTGQEYIVTGEPSLPDDNNVPLSERRLNQADLAESLNREHLNFMNKHTNQLHIVNTGWIAVPYKYEVTEPIICEIGDKQGVWNFASKWEGKLKAKKKDLLATEKQIRELKGKPLSNLLTKSHDLKK